MDRSARARPQTKKRFQKERAFRSRAGAGNGKRDLSRVKFIMGRVQGGGSAPSLDTTAASKKDPFTVGYQLLERVIFGVCKT